MSAAVLNQRRRVACVVTRAPAQRGDDKVEAYVPAIMRLSTSQDHPPSEEALATAAAT